MSYLGDQFYDVCNIQLVWRPVLAYSLLVLGGADLVIGYVLAKHLK